MSSTPLLLLAWIVASFICACLWALAGLRITRMQERGRPIDMSWPGKPMRIIDGELADPVPSIDQRFRETEGV